MKRNIDLTIDRDFRKAGAINSSVGIILDTVAETIEERESYESSALTETERLTGVLSGTKEEIERKERHLQMEKEMNDNCHRCGKLLDFEDVLEICRNCDRILELQVLGRL